MKKYSTNYKSNSRRKRRLARSLALIVLLILVAIILEAMGAIDVINSSNKKNTATNNINYSPPTKSEAEAGDKQKEEIIQQETGQSQTPPNDSSSGKKTVTPIIVSATRDGIRGFVPGITENGGTCTAKFSQGSTTVTRTSSAFFDVNKTSCTPISLNSSDLGNGEWLVTLMYQSATAEGTSDAVKIQ